jgi:uncharacterized protein (TIGR03437 family)
MKVSTSQTLLALSGAAGLLFLGLIILFASGDSPVKAQDEKLSLVGKNFSPAQLEEPRESSPGQAASVAAPNSAAGPAQVVTELAVDDGTNEAAVGASGGGTVWGVNRLTPTSYPATLTGVSIFFQSQQGLSQGSPITVLVGTNPSGSANINNIAFSQQINAVVETVGIFHVYQVTPVTINSGDFVVGFRATHPAGQLPLAIDRTAPMNRRSYISQNGTTFTILDDAIPEIAGNLMIRARVQGQTPSCHTVSGLTPASGGAGSQVTITGSNFTGVSSVRFANNVNATFTVNSNTQITATVPQGAVTGPITISKPNCPDATTAVFTVPGVSCTYSITPTSRSIGAEGGVGSVTVTTQAGCAWTATSNVNWITITAGGSGSGSGAVSYSVASNAGNPPRSGTLTIAGRTFTVDQGGCSYTLSASSQTFSSSGGNGSVNVTAAGGCMWTAASNADWIAINSGNSGNGNGAVNYSVAANTGAPRIGTMTIAGRTFTVAQGSDQPTPYRGSWQGTTDQNLPLRFTVDNNDIVVNVEADVRITYTVPPFGSATCTYRLRGEAPAIINNGQFEVTLTSTGATLGFLVNAQPRVRATFSSASASSGQITSSTVGLIICGSNLTFGSISVGQKTWNAQKQAQPGCHSATGVNPTSGAPGSQVTIQGSGFTGVNAVRFANNVNATFTVNSDTQISATVPQGAVTGPITISKPNCPDVTTAAFAVTGGAPTQGVWTPQTSGVTNDLRSVHFLNENEGWVAGLNATLLRTTNGGVNWSPITSTTVDAANGFNAVRAIDQNTVWVGGRSAAIRSVDGGTTWGGRQWNAASGIPFQNSLFAVSANVAWGIGPGPRAHQRHEFLTSIFLTTVFNVTSPNTNDVYFVGLDSGGWSVGDTGRITRISNANSNAALTQQTSGTTQNLNGVCMLDANTGWIVGDSGTILKTINGGAAWTPQTSGVSANLRDVHFVDANRGWAVGDGGVILTTSNGGATWAAETSGVTVNLRSVFFVNATTGFAVGDNGTILKRGGSSVGSLASVSAASFLSAELAPESIVAAFGQNLATTTQTASGVPLPTELAGTTVKVRDSAGVTHLAGILNAASVERPAGLFFVAPTQVNYQIPPGTAPGPATVTITSGAGAVSAGTVNIANVAPGLFAANANGQGVAAAVVFRRRADGSESFEPVAQFDQAQNRFVSLPIDLGPETDQVFLILYGVGFRFRSSLAATAVTLGGVNSEVLFAGATPGFVGLDQCNVRLPRSLVGRGEVDVVLTVDGKTANTVRIAIK